MSVENITRGSTLAQTQREYILAVRAMSEEFERLHGYKPRCMARTYGCQQNENDTERIKGMLAAMGYDFVEDPESAELIIFNTCAIREHAERKILGHLGAVLPYRRAKPDMKIVLCGCMTGQPHIAELIRKSYKYVDMAFSPGALYRLPQNLYKLLSGQKYVFDFEGGAENISEGMPVLREGKTKAWVSIMSGCNNFCTYCIVPYVRGRERSRSPEAVLEEVRELVKSGYKEITLLGQNVNSYCKDLQLGYDFADLLRDINSIEGDFRVKFMTSHPKDATRKLFDVIAECGKIGRHVHLPFQSGSDAILQKMNRKYTCEQYMQIIDYAKSKIPGVSFSSDVIVGFPGETEEDFEKTLQLVRRVEFSSLFMFIYSPRRGTPAAEMPDQVPHEISVDRFNRLAQLQNSISLRRNERLIGQTVTVLTDKPDGGSLYGGKTADDIRVRFDSHGTHIPEGQSVQVKIERAANWAVFGQTV